MKKLGIIVMRLETINPTLARRFLAFEDIGDARRTFESIFNACVRQTDESVFAYMDDLLLEESLKTGLMPECFDFDHYIGELDRHYSVAEGEGRSKDAVAYFVLARLMSALFFASSAKSPRDYAEAVYEAVMSSPRTARQLSAHRD
ncbi:hypothetical protein [Ciceribacter sp. RN22]|uniref:hypothetical protein n=1 Tax=Ciceribacter sp. RN22 TaxID=2954932 RepID=UPI0020924783|nr:hypothetical protein [Ciceribacter sp. RN22]MCO6180916.1 hypothetical protein [Ciceribacter sp. RN22]